MVLVLALAVFAAGCGSDSSTKDAAQKATAKTVDAKPVGEPPTPSEPASAPDPVKAPASEPTTAEPATESPSEPYKACDNVVFSKNSENMASDVKAHGSVTCEEAKVVVTAVKAACSSAATKPCTYKSGEFTCTGAPNTAASLPSANFVCSGEKGLRTITFTKT